LTDHDESNQSESVSARKEMVCPSPGRGNPRWGEKVAEKVEKRKRKIGTP